MRDGPGRHSGCPLHRQVCVSRWKDGLGAHEGSTGSGFAVLSRSRLSSGAGEAQSLLCAACVVIHWLCCRAAPWVGSGSAEALSWLSEGEQRLLSSAAAAVCPILIPLAQGTGSPAGRFLPSSFFSRQRPLVATGHLTSCSLHAGGSAGQGCQAGGTSSAQHWVLPAQPWFSAPAGNCLFFGCRHQSKDFYCQTEWEELVTKGFLTLFTAFSRDQVSAQKRRPLLPPHVSVLAEIPSCPAEVCLAKLGWKGYWDKAGEQQSR